MTYIPNRDFHLEVAKGNVPGHSIVHKFGRNASVGTSIVPVCQGGFFRTPTSGSTLAIISDSVNDTATGTGAREITIEYLDSSFNTQTGTITTSGDYFSRGKQ